MFYSQLVLTALVEASQGVHVELRFFLLMPPPLPYFLQVGFVGRVSVHKRKANIWGGFSSPKQQPRGQGQLTAKLVGRRGREEDEEGGLSEAD